MPFYSTESIENVQLRTGNPGEYKPLAGEFMKAGVVTYRKGTGSKPHWHEDEEQYIYVIEGKRYMRLGDEERIIGPGDIVHIPRGTLHGGRTLTEKAVMFVAKSPPKTPTWGPTTTTRRIWLTSSSISTPRRRNSSARCKL